MYMPGRFRTGSSPSRTWMLLESYPGCCLVVLVLVVRFAGVANRPPIGPRDAHRGHARGVRRGVARTPLFYRKRVTFDRISRLEIRSVTCGFGCLPLPGRRPPARL